MGGGFRTQDRVPIDYARPAVEQPPRSRVIVQPGETGITFIDPPLTGVLLRRTALSRLAIPALCWTAFGTVAALATSLRFFLGCAAAVLTLLIFFESRRLFRLARFATTIEAGRDELALRLGPRRHIVIPACELDGVHASRPILIGRLLGRNSSLIVSAWGRPLTALADRDYAEMQWLARQLLIATGRAGDRGPAAGPRAAKKTRRQFLFKEYHDLRCAPGLFLLASVVIGFFVTSRLAERLVICLQFGLNAYFRKGVRPIPHHGFFELNNGQQISDAYKVLFFGSWGCMLLAWAFLSLLVAIGWNRLADRLQRRRWRLRAEREKQNRTCRQIP